ncbi:hypothetical protein LV476_10035 [Guyparkeria hydrothermalis]|uniref:hypothetical protein n=1 Tax=Guyparkeria hydrothermalis TaxID=923 RepID=UPI002021D566|nr:hypothetical protein [Guyparkeria hydrothermalis]MCL7745273.1 hypothetical protein [Guyparkeria hydrothermalis]
MNASKPSTRPTWLSLHGPFAGLALALSLSPAGAADLTARTAVLGTIAHPNSGDLAADQDWPNADQQSLRLMLDDVTEIGDWSLHVKTRRLHSNGLPLDATATADRFRYRPLSQDWIDRGHPNDGTRVGYELDRAVYRWRHDDLAFSVGRQPIDWGAGRFWQPLNVFGAFTPTDLDTDFKPGIDAAVFDWYPGPLSALTLAYVLSPQDESTEDSVVLHYRRQLGNGMALATLAGRVREANVIGASLEGDLGGMGWRVEATRHGAGEDRDDYLFWVAGVDYQLDDGTLLIAEWYDNGAGAGQTDTLPGLTAADGVTPGLVPHLGRQVLGVGAEKDLTPLLRGSYTLLASPLRTDQGDRQSSLLHQLNLTWSLSNESDLLVSLLFASGRGLADDGRPRSEFGHVPASLTVRWRHYF